MKPHHHKKREYREKQALHIVLKSYETAFSSPRARQIIDSQLLKYGKYFDVKVYHRAIVADHIHLIVMPKSQKSLSGFLRVVSGQIAAKLRKLIPNGYRDMIWSSRPWSRVISWGRDYGTAIRYAALNYLEGIKLIVRTSGKRKNRDLQAFSWLIDEVFAKKLTVPA